MEVKILNKKQRGKSAGIRSHNSAISKMSKNDFKINNIKKIKNLSLINKKNSSKEKNERALSDQNNKKPFSNNINNINNINSIFPKPKKVQRPKSYNFIQINHKNENITNKKKAKVININHISNNINYQRNEIKINLAGAKNISMNKNINITKKNQKPISGYNAFKNKKNSINKISSTEEKKEIKKSHQPKIQTSNLFVKSNKNEIKKINSSYHNRIKKNQIPIKSATNKNEKNKNNKLNPNNHKIFTKNNKSIENQKVNNISNISGKRQKCTKEKLEDFFNRKMLNSAQKKEKEKNNKNSNKFKNTNKKFTKKQDKSIKDNNINKLINNNKPKDKNKIKEKKPDKINPKITQIENYTQPTLIGLNNIGSTCFINAILQCLSQTKALTNYFLNEKNKDKIINNNIALNNKSDNQLTPCYLELINKLWNKTPSETKSFSPSNFVQKLNEMNPLFKLGEAGDSKDFIIFILEQIHRELKKPLNIKNKIPETLNQYDNANAFENFFNEFKSEVSIISDVFFGVNETTNVCLNCKANYNSRNQNNPISYNYGIFNCLIFPLEEVKNMKLKNNMNQGNNQALMNSNNKVNIYDCFDYYQKSDLFNGDNKYYCNICKQENDSIYTCKIFTSPNYLILILNRGRGNIYKVQLDFPEIIDITEYVLKKETPNIIYNLYGVVTHIGQSGPNAHFIASCKSPVDGKWYKYNDAIVNMITDVKKEIFDFGTPYILFYQKDK